MRKSFGVGIFIVAFIVAVLVSLGPCGEYIPIGTSGVVYTLKDGATGEIVTNGWHWKTPFKHFKRFTTSSEQLVLSKDKREGSENDDSFYVASADNANLKISFQMSYHFIEEDLVNTYKKFGRLSGEQIVDTRLKTVLKAEVSEVTHDYSLMELYAGNRAEVNDKLTQYLAERFRDKYGIEVTDASIINVHPSKELKKAINQKVKAKQAAETAKAEAETAKAKAETAKIEAQKNAEVKLIKAKADAESKLIEAKAEAKANKELSKSLGSGDNLVKKLWIEKWKGNVPQITGGKDSSYIIDIK